MDPIEMLYDDNNTDNITLYNEEGEAIEFEQIALIPLDERDFAILRPVEAPEGMAEDEAFVFAIEEVDGEEDLILVEDDDIVDAVFEEYYTMLRAEGIEVD